MTAESSTGADVGAGHVHVGDAHDRDFLVRKRYTRINHYRTHISLAWLNVVYTYPRAPIDGFDDKEIHG